MLMPTSVEEGFVIVITLSWIEYANVDEVWLGSSVYVYLIDSVRGLGRVIVYSVDVFTIAKN